MPVYASILLRFLIEGSLREMDDGALSNIGWSVNQPYWCIGVLRITLPVVMGKFGLTRVYGTKVLVFLGMMALAFRWDGGSADVREGNVVNFSDLLNALLRIHVGPSFGDCVSEV